MGFLNALLGRPANERPFLLLVVGYPADNAHVPVITKKRLEDVATFVRTPDAAGEAEANG
jgi:hypothetical protein